MKWIVIWVVFRLVLVSDYREDEFGRQIHNNDFGLVPRRDTFHRWFGSREDAEAFYLRAQANQTPDGTTADVIESVWRDSMPIDSIP